MNASETREKQPSLSKFMSAMTITQAAQGEKTGISSKYTRELTYGQGIYSSHGIFTAAMKPGGNHER